MNEESNTEESGDEKNAGRPAAKFSGTGGLNVAVWKHKSESGHDNYSVKMERSYKDNEGEFQSTPYLRDGDLLRAGKLLEQADDWIEQDRGRQRSQLGGQGR